MCFPRIPLLYFYGGKEESCCDVVSEESFENGRKKKSFKFIWKDKESGMGFVSDTTKSTQLSVLFQYQKVKGAFFFFDSKKKHKISFVIIKREELICSDFT